MTVETKDLEEEIEFLSKQNIKLCKQTENAEEILSQHEAYISLLENENQQLKELLLQIRNRQSLIREYLSGCKLGSAWDLLYQTENEIDNAIGEKKC